MSSLTSTANESKRATRIGSHSSNRIKLVRTSGEGSRFGLLMGGLAALAALSGIAVAVAELNALFVGVSLLACIFIFIDFRIGIVLLIVLMPISASSLFPHSIAGVVGLNPLNLLLFGTLGSYLLRGSSARSLARLAPWPLLWLYVLPMVMAALLGYRHVGEIPSYFYTLNELDFTDASGYFRDMLVKPLFMVLFALLIGAAISRSMTLKMVLLPMIVSVWVMCLLTIVFVYLSGVSLGELASSSARNFFTPLGMHANDLGRLYAIAYALMLFTLSGTSDYRLRSVLILSMVAVVAALVLTFSRGAFFGFIVVNALFLLSRRKVKILLLGIAFVVALIFLLPGAVYERVGAGWGGGLNAISAGRVDEIWMPLLPELWRSPVYGNGLGSILWSDAMRSGSILQVTHPHNAYLQAALDTGVLGLILLCAYFIHVWKAFRRLSKDVLVSPAERGFYEGAAAGLVSFILSGFVGSSLMPVPEQSFLWLAIGMMYGQRATMREN